MTCTSLRRCQFVNRAIASASSGSVYNCISLTLSCLFHCLRSLRDSVLDGQAGSGQGQGRSDSGVKKWDEKRYASALPTTVVRLDASASGQGDSGSRPATSTTSTATGAGARAPTITSTSTASFGGGQPASTADAWTSRLSHVYMSDDEDGSESSEEDMSMSDWFARRRQASNSNSSTDIVGQGGR